MQVKLGVDFKKLIANRDKPLYFQYQFFINKKKKFDCFPRVNRSGSQMLAVCLKTSQNITLVGVRSPSHLKFNQNFNLTRLSQVYFILFSKLNKFN